MLPFMKSCEFFPEKEQIITVDLASLPPPPPKEEDDPVEEDEPEEQAISEATPVPTPPPVPTPTATPQPEATVVPTSTPQAQPSPTPTPKRKLLTPEEIRARIEQNNPAPPPVATRPAISQEELERLMGVGLPSTGGSGTSIGPVNAGNVSFGGVSSELYKRLFSAWDQPMHLSGRSGLEVTVSVVVLKNGNIGSSRITRSSGNAELDASVQKALSAVRFAKPLPDSYSGVSRAFQYIFELSQ